MRVLFLPSKRRIVCALAVFLLLTAAAVAALLVNPLSPTTAASPKSLPIYKVQTDQPKVAISFDASWGAEYTESILDTLDEYGVTATFFLVTIWVEDYPELVAEIAARGHEIGLHSTTHPHFTELSDEQIAEELEENYLAVVSCSTAFPVLFRPPFGDYDSRVVDLVHEAGLECIQWSVDSLDWKNLSAEEIFNRVTCNISAGDIVLFHNNGLHTAEALPMILDCFKQQSLQAVSVSELLLDGGYYVDSQGVQRPITSAQ